MTFQEFMWQTTPWMVSLGVVLLVCNHMSLIHMYAKLIIELKRHNGDFDGDSK